MIVDVEMTSYLARLAGCESMRLDLPDGATVADAVARVSSGVSASAQAVLGPGQPSSLLVSLDNDVCADWGATPVHHGGSLRLLLPVAGG